MRFALVSSIALIVLVSISLVHVSINFKVSNMSGLSEPKMMPKLKVVLFPTVLTLPKLRQPAERLRADHPPAVDVLLAVFPVAHWHVRGDILGLQGHRPRHSCIMTFSWLNCS
jgi:hypothetical protein